MGCEVVVAGGSASERRAIERLFSLRERTFSRFIPGSELNRVNAAAGKPVRVSRAFAEMLAVALDAARETSGLVDPTLGAELEAAGYDADFSLLEQARRAPGPTPPRMRGVVRLAERFVLVPKG